MPRHPPNAHKNKQHNTRQNTCRRLTVRCSRPLYSSQPTHPHPPPPLQQTERSRKSGPGNQGALPQNPDSMPPPHHAGTPTTTKPGSSGRVSYASTRQPTPPQHPPHRQDTRAPASHPAFRGQQPPGRPGPNYTAQTRSNDQEATPTQPILRKEVIQPHLPVRLPCYDFVPIASPTFNRSP